MSYNRQRNNNLCSSFQSLSLNSKRPTINPNKALIDNLDGRPFKGDNLHPSDTMYEIIIDKIDNDAIVVDNIVGIDNPTLARLYAEKKEEKRKEYGLVNEKLLFHGTKKDVVNDICTYNFDPRLSGNETGHRFGQGVCFSPSAWYATNYGDADSYKKVMIWAKVLISKICEGNKGMRFPPAGYDTSQKRNGDVIVKYEDNEFYPAYKVYYHLEESDSEDDSSNDDDDYY